MLKLLFTFRFVVIAASVNSTNIRMITATYKCLSPYESQLCQHSIFLYAKFIIEKQCLIFFITVSKYFNILICHLYLFFCKLPNCFFVNISLTCLYVLMDSSHFKNIAFYLSYWLQILFHNFFFLSLMFGPKSYS